MTCDDRYGALIAVLPLMWALRPDALEALAATMPVASVFDSEPESHSTQAPAIQALDAGNGHA